ncbi:MAG: mannose-6-phosphate isomerase, class I [Actinomycetota bacterium]
MERLAGVIRDYDWGDFDALAGILGHEPPGHPEAEYWLGAHPGAPSGLVSGGTLDAAIAAAPGELLGPSVSERFGQLPYLVKILAAGKPLSIQTHPSLDQAKVGWAREEAAGVAVSAPDRNYRDDNHKPELICALTPFEARCGFREPARTDEVLARLGPELDDVRRELAANGPAATTAWLLRLPAERGRALATAAAAGAAAAAGGQDERSEPASAVATELASVVEVERAFPGDVGVVVALLLNHVVLDPGEALFLRAGTLHAYLRGVGVEVMANSDNVIRGGLTPKHIDVEELLAIVDDAVGPAPVQAPGGPIHTYTSPIPEFQVTRIDSTGAAAQPDGASIEPIELASGGPEVVLVTAGSATLTSRSGDRLDLTTGDAAFVGASDGPGTLTVGQPGSSQIWRVTVGRSG